MEDGKAPSQPWGPQQDPSTTIGDALQNARELEP